MRLKGNVDNEVISSGMPESQDFQIKSSKHAFQILSSNLYKDKIKAVIRELCCNAYDSHIMANQTKPFQIQLPSVNSNEFVVQDWGVGLSEEEVYDLYTTYFSSNKNDSNDYIGALGLGSKSPFSYAYSFKVVSTYEGIESQYLCYLDDYFPKVMKLYDKPTENENGMKVSLSMVDSDDYLKFQDKAKKILRAFPQESFEVIYDEPFETDPRGIRKAFTESIYRGDNYELYDERYDSKGSYIVQGNIEYPITDYISPVKYVDINKRRFYSIFSVYATVPNGTFSISASREELSLTEREKDMLEEYLESIYQNFMSTLDKTIKSLPTLFEQYSQSIYLDNVFDNLEESIVLPSDDNTFTDSLKLRVSYEGVLSKPMELNEASLIGKEVYGTYQKSKIQFYWYDKEVFTKRKSHIYYYFRRLPTQNVSMVFLLSKKDWEILGKPPIESLSEIPDRPKIYRKTPSTEGARYIRYCVTIDPNKIVSEDTQDILKGITKVRRNKKISFKDIITIDSHLYTPTEMKKFMNETDNRVRYFIQTNIKNYDKGVDICLYRSTRDSFNLLFGILYLKVFFKNISIPKMEFNFVGLNKQEANTKRWATLLQEHQDFLINNSVTNMYTAIMHNMRSVPPKVKFLYNSMMDIRRSSTRYKDYARIQKVISLHQRSGAHVPRHILKIKEIISGVTDISIVDWQNARFNLSTSWINVPHHTFNFIDKRLGSYVEFCKSDPKLRNIEVINKLKPLR